MRINRYALLLFLFITSLLFSGCTSRKSPGGTRPAVKEPSASVHDETPLVGGYAEISTDSKEAVESYTFLENEISTSYPQVSLINVQKAEIQIVSGWNTKLLCEYSIGDNKDPHYLEAVIYKDLSQNLTLKDLKLDISS